MNFVIGVVLTIVFAALGWFMANGRSKSQAVRLLDVLLYGPYLTYLVLALQNNNTYQFSLIEQIFLLFLGVTTITYNAKNYFKLRQ
jgi:hypothetical protein